MANINSSVVGENGCLADDLPLDIMRIGIENKGIFGGKNAGALYCFTGSYVTKTFVTEDGKTETYQIPVTIVINGPQNIDSGLKYGIKFNVGEGGTVIGGELVEI